MPMMRAAVLVAPRQFEVQQVPRPELKANEVLIRIQGCGLCASNIPPFEGREWFHYPLPPGDLGHEAWGVISAVGEAVTDVQVGQRVAALSYRGYAEYDVAPADQVVPLPSSLDDQPFPGEALGCAMNIFRRAQITAGQYVAVVGSGFLGNILVRLASATGATVIALARSASSLATARLMGAAHTLPMDGRALETVQELTRGALCARVIEATGKQEPLDLASALTAEGGRLVIAGYHQDGWRSVDMQLWNWRGIDVINAHERNRQVALQGIHEAIEAVVSGLLPLAPLLTHRYTLTQMTQALHDVSERPAGFIKGYLDLEAPNDA